MDGICGTRLYTGCARETIRNDSVLFQDGFHDGRRASLGTGLTGDTGLIIHVDFEEAHFFDDPTHESERAEEVAPRSVNEERDERKPTNEEKACDSSVKRIKYSERVDGFYEIGCPQKSCEDDEKEKSCTDGIRENERRLQLPEDCFLILWVTVEAKEEILKRSKLATPGTDEFVRDEHHEQEDRESEYSWWKDHAALSEQYNGILHGSHGTWIGAKGDPKDHDGCDEESLPLLRGHSVVSHEKEHHPQKDKPGGKLDGDFEPVL